MLDEIRLVNFLVSALASMFLWLRFNDHRPRTRPERAVRHLIVVAFAFGALGSLEHYARRSDVTITSQVFPFICAGILLGLWMSRTRR